MEGKKKYLSYSGFWYNAPFCPPLVTTLLLGLFLVPRNDPHYHPLLKLCVETSQFSKGFCQCCLSDSNFAKLILPCYCRRGWMGSGWGLGGLGGWGGKGPAWSVTSMKGGALSLWILSGPVPVPFPVRFSKDTILKRVVTKKKVTSGQLPWSLVQHVPGKLAQQKYLVVTDSGLLLTLNCGCIGWPIPQG